MDSTSTDSCAQSKVPDPAYAWHEAVEDLERYGPGGYHPVHLGDKFSAGRYEVIYKLGYGSYSTVWLCRDVQTECYVSVKVGVSDARGAKRRNEFESEILHTLRSGNPTHPGKRFVIPLLDEFTLEGPNGRHQCFVLPVALNSVAIAKEASISDNFMFPAHVGRSIATQSLLALSYIHSCGIVHAGRLLIPNSDIRICSHHCDSDLHTDNILVQAPSSKSWPLSEPYEHPEKLRVRRYDGAPIGPNVPEYQIKPAGIFTPSDTLSPDCNVLITDFGEAFFMPTADGAVQKSELNTPVLVRPFETIFGYPITSAADIWTIGMAIFDILGHSKLFQDLWPDEDSVVLEAISTFGPLPPNMWRVWPSRSKFFKEDGSWQEGKKPYESGNSTSFTDRLRECMEHDADSKTYGYSDEELRSLERLLRSMLQYEPKARITANQALGSEWARDYGIPALLKAIPDIDLSSLGIDSTVGARRTG